MFVFNEQYFTKSSFEIDYSKEKKLQKVIDFSEKMSKIWLYKI